MPHAATAFPGGEPRPKPGPYRGGDGEASSRGNGAGLAERRPSDAEVTGPEQDSDGVRVSLPPRE